MQTGAKLSLNLDISRVGSSAHVSAELRSSRIVHPTGDSDAVSGRGSALALGSSSDTAAAVCAAVAAVWRR